MQNEEIMEKLCLRPIVEIPTFFTEHPDGLTIIKNKDSFRVMYPEMVNFNTLKYHIRNVIKNEPSAIMVTHTNAENSTLSFKEHIKIIKVAIETAGEIPIIAGTGSNSTAEAIELTLAAEDLKATAALIPLPYYNRPPIKGVKLHMRTIKKYAKTIPLIMCLHQERSNSEINAETVIQLMKEGTIQGLLIENCERDLITNIIENHPPNCKVFSSDRLMPALMSLGAEGVVSSVANFDFARIDKIFQMLKSKNYNGITGLQNELQFICATMKHVVRPISLKTILSILDDQFEERFRSPLCPMSQMHKKCLVNMLNHCNIT
ncbi:MAG: dihydrodipicolinate synthase family protein [bacterium]